MNLNEKAIAYDLIKDTHVGMHYGSELEMIKMGELQKRTAELETVLKKIWKISSNRTGIRFLIDKVLSEGDGDER